MFRQLFPGRGESFAAYTRRLAAGFGRRITTRRLNRQVRRVDELLRRLAPERIDVPLIRIGPATGDGGYLVPDDLVGVTHAISPGVGPVVGFDLDLVERGMTVTMLDASVAGPPVENPAFDFRPLFLDDHVSATTTTLDHLLAETPSGDLFLEMDIEGAEWRVLNALSVRGLTRFRVMVIEFHGLSGLMNPRQFRLMGGVLTKLLVTHRVVHVHFNNAAAMKQIGSETMGTLFELTFLRRDRSEGRGRAPLPHPLDTPNLPDRPELPIPQILR